MLVCVLCLMLRLYTANLMKIYFINKDPRNMYSIYDNQFKGNYKLNVQKLSNTLCTQCVVFRVHAVEFENFV